MIIFGVCSKLIISKIFLIMERGARRQRLMGDAAPFKSNSERMKFFIFFQQEDSIVEVEVIEGSKLGVQRTVKEGGSDFTLKYYDGSGQGKDCTFGSCLLLYL